MTKIFLGAHRNPYLSTQHRFMAEAYSLYQVNEFLKRTIALNFPNEIWVKAEIAQIRESRGHWYLELVEKAEGQDEIIAQSSAAIWRGTYATLARKIGSELKGILADGMEVMVKCKMTYHERYGLKMNITDVQPEYTIGRLAKERAATIAKLKQLKLMDVNKLLEAQIVLQKVAVISAITAAGYQDFHQQLAENSMGYDFVIDLYPAAMQGINAEPEVLKQLKNIAEKKYYDAVVIIRGGGAKLDLVAFDSLMLATAVAKFPLPVLVGIGHDIDESVIDMVAYKSLKTPTAVAEYIIAYNQVFEEGLLANFEEIRENVLDRLQIEKDRLTKNEEYVKLRIPAKLVEKRLALTRIKSFLQVQIPQQLNLEKQRLTYLTKGLQPMVKSKLDQLTSNIITLEKQVALLSPDATLARGYSISLLNGKTISAKNKPKKGDNLTTLTKIGQVESTINNYEPKK